MHYALVGKAPRKVNHLFLVSNWRNFCLKLENSDHVKKCVNSGRDWNSHKRAHFYQIPQLVLQLAFLKFRQILYIITNFLIFLTSIFSLKKISDPFLQQLFGLLFLIAKIKRIWRNQVNNFFNSLECNFWRKLFS